MSGAGKTTLLDVLATRVTMGVVGGRVQVDGRPRDESFQRKTGYVQQQDVHLETSTIREALEFSALLRQPRHVPKEEKLAYVDEVLKLLEMDSYADAVIGAPGEGLAQYHSQWNLRLIGRAQRGTTKTSYDRRRAGSSTGSLVVPGRADLRARLSNILEYPTASPETCSSRSSHSVHDSPAVRDPV